MGVPVMDATAERVAKRLSCGIDAKTLARRWSNSVLPGSVSGSLELRFFRTRRCTPGRLPPPPPRLGGTWYGWPVASSVIVDPSLLRFRRWVSERA